jgi:hypothetical protein
MWIANGLLTLSVCVTSGKMRRGEDADEIPGVRGMDLVLDHHFFYGLLIGIAVAILWRDFHVSQKAEKTEPTDFDWNRLLDDLRSEDYHIRNSARKDVNKATASYMSFRLAYNDLINQEATRSGHKESKS